MPARILIAHGTHSSAGECSEKLMGEYYDVVTKIDSAGLLDSIQEQEPDLILLGVDLPSIGGLEACRIIKENPQSTHIPVLLVNNAQGAIDKVSGLEAGADDVLAVPISDDILFARVRSLVRFKQTLDQWRLREETTQKMGFPNNEVILPLDDGAQARITLVDDNDDRAVAIDEALSENHDRVSVIGSFKDAVNRVIKAAPDVLIVNLMSVSEDPLRLCSTLRSSEHTRQLPILVAGDETNMGLLIKALELGVNDYITLPHDARELRARVQTLVRRKRYQDRLQTSFLQSLSMALTDSLTGLHNRRYFSTHLEALFNRTVENGKPLALLMIDIDHFKEVNDTYGHAVGDEVLSDVAQQIARNVRAFDLVARYGGEEFVVVMPDTAQEVAVAVADRLRDKIDNQETVVADSAAGIHVSVSIGISFAKPEKDAPDDLLQRADRALYQAKDAGRNRVVTEPGGEGAVHLKTGVK